MAEKAKKRRVVKPAKTVRSEAAKNTTGNSTKRSKLSHSRNSDSKKQRREYHLPLPDNKAGRFLGKKVRFIPSYFGEAWTELKQVTWPSRRETLKLSLAVFIFAIVFGGLIWLVDYGLDNLFRKVLLG